MSTNNQRAVTGGTWSRRRLLGTAATLSGAAWLAACSGSGGGGDALRSGGAATSAPAGGTGAAATAAAANEPPKRGGKVTFVRQGGPPASFHSQVDYAMSTFLSGALVFDRPFTARFLQPYKLEAAESIEQPDPLTVVMKLKPGLKYQNLPPVNGRDVTAEDYVAARLNNKALPNSYQNAFERDGMDTITAQDARTIVVKLKSPRAYLFSGGELGTAAGNQIIPKELLEGLAANANPVGSGPYQQTSDTVKDVSYRYKRNEGFRTAAAGAPYVDEREYKILTDASAIDAGFRSQQIDYWMTPTNTQAKRLGTDLGAKVVVTKFLTPQTFTINMNPTRAPWTDPRVREAMYRTINRKQALDLVWQGEGVLPNGLLSAALTDYQLGEAETAKYWKNDPQAARQLLQAAGFDFNKEYLTVMPAGQPLTNQCAEVVQQQMQAVGVKTRLVVATGPEWFSWVRDTGEFDFTYSNNPAFDTPSQGMRFHHSKTNFIVFFAGLKDPKFDALVEKTETTVDTKEQVKLVKETQLALLDAYTTLFPMNTVQTYHVNWAYLKNFASPPAITYLPDQFADLWVGPK